MLVKDRKCSVCKKPATRMVHMPRRVKGKGRRWQPACDGCAERGRQRPASFWNSKENRGRKHAEQLARAQKMLKAGVQLSEVARRMGMPRQTLADRLR